MKSFVFVYVFFYLFNFQCLELDDTDIVILTQDIIYITQGCHEHLTHLPSSSFKLSLGSLISMKQLRLCLLLCKVELFQLKFKNFSSSKSSCSQLPRITNLLLVVLLLSIVEVEIQRENVASLIKVNFATLYHAINSSEKRIHNFINKLPNKFHSQLGLETPFSLSLPRSSVISESQIRIRTRMEKGV